MWVCRRCAFVVGSVLVPAFRAHAALALVPGGLPPPAGRLGFLLSQVLSSRCYVGLDSCWTDFGLYGSLSRVDYMLWVCVISFLDACVAALVLSCLDARWTDYGLYGLLSRVDCMLVGCFCVVCGCFSPFGVP